jgi:ABC-type cobalamin/Fe3+-siderophores transport system ATPase subunit
MDWLLLSGEEPIAGRSDGSPFGDLVHSILQWQGIDYERAEYALRQYAQSSRSLAGDRELLIADKPSTALDLTTQAEIARKIKRVEKRHGLRLILMTYDFGLARSVGDRVYLLRGALLTEVGRRNLKRD